jgi:phage baseplate assembly protein W
MLFETVESYSETLVREMIEQAIKRDEPRVEVTNVTFYDGKTAIERGVQSLRDNFRNTVYIKVEFRIENSEGTFTASVNMNRLR